MEIICSKSSSCFILDTGRLEKIVKNKTPPTGHVVGKPLDSFKTLYEKRLYRKLMQILNDPTHPMRHYFDSRRSNRSGRLLLPRTNTNRYKASFYPRLCQFLMKIIPVINCVCACAKTSVEVDNFLREGWGCVNLMIFIWEFLRFGLTEKAWFQVILGLLLLTLIERKGAYV